MATTTAAPTTTTQPAVTTTTTVPPYSFDGSVPAPELVNTGDDHVAIAQSLLAYIAWLKRHNPDPELLKNVYVEGTDIHARAVDGIGSLRDQGYRFYDVDQRFDVQVVSADGDVVTCIVTEHLAAERVIDRTGRVVEERSGGPMNESIALLVRGVSGRWRIGSVSQRMTGAEVRL